jgi:hypothetical protein
VRAATIHIWGQIYAETVNLLEINVMTRLNRRLFSFSHESRKSACKRNTARPSQRRSHWVDLATGLQMEALERRLLLSGIPTSIAIAVSTQQAAYGQPIQLTASVAALPTDPSEGTVTFVDKGTVLGSSAVESGAATLDVRLPVGSHLLTASYNDAQGVYAPSTTTAQSNSPITTVAGGGLGLNIAATSAELSYPSAVATDAAGDLFIAVNYGILEAYLPQVALGISAGFPGSGGPLLAAARPRRWPGQTAFADHPAVTIVTLARATARCPPCGTRGRKKVATRPFDVSRAELNLRQSSFT